MNKSMSLVIALLSITAIASSAQDKSMHHSAMATRHMVTKHHRKVRHMMVKHKDRSTHHAAVHAEHWLDHHMSAPHKH
jgi:hypothetical protein